MTLYRMIFASGLLVFSSTIWAFDFVPQSNEFNMWDTRCKALYLSTTIGRKSQFAGLLPASVITEHRNYADSIHSGAWHFCAGLIHMTRARLAAGDKLALARHLDRALIEVSFTVRGVDKDAPEFLESSVVLGNVKLARKEYDDAAKTFDKVIMTSPGYVPAYLAKSILLKKQDKVAEAVNLLESIDESIRSQSAEVTYYLGLFHLRLGNLDNAKLNAQLAYGLGYPLPGLRNLLLEKGVIL